MVSSLWKACQDGDVQRVDDLLADNSVDIEIKGEPLHSLPPAPADSPQTTRA
ncbi:hypothetical protein K439DRAFT_1641704 [Ramaria rubella]|nr:hypothetical protein K439DRAFT_1641704 [Ramaria rubella]